MVGVGDSGGGDGSPDAAITEVEGEVGIEVEVPVKKLKYKHARGGRRFSYNKFK